MTVVEGILQVYSLSSNSCRILACVPSNSASDLIVRRGKEREREGGREAEGERKRERERERKRGRDGKGETANKHLQTVIKYMY